MERQTILIADDDPEIREVIRLLLTGEGYTIREAGDGRAAVDAVDAEIDLIILDVMMPEMSGYSACTEIRKKSDAPILFLTAKSQDSDKTMGFSVGADDYLAKPFARVKAMLRRYCVYGTKNGAVQNDTIVFGELTIDKAAGTVFVCGQEVALTDIEYHILLLLSENRKRIFSVQNIYEAVWNEPYFYVSNNTVMVHMRNLRRKLTAAGLPCELIKNVWGKGYRIEA